MIIPVVGSLAATISLAWLPLLPTTDVRAHDAASLSQAVRNAAPGTRILLAPGTYSGDLYFDNVHGAPGKEIVVSAADPHRPPVFEAANVCLHFSRVSYLRLENLVLRRAAGNGLNIDDGGVLDVPSHHVTLRRLHVSDIGPAGNHDGIKLSGLDRFAVESCTVERWGAGGSGIDMVGCHKGRILDCVFRKGGSDAIQAKGGCADLVIRGCRFDDYGERGVNIGGSTGFAFFRPRLEALPPLARYEARGILVEQNVFIGGTTPVAFVGVDGAVVRFNTIYHPGRWALRILQETVGNGFLPSRNGIFSDNIVVFRSDQWVGGGVNIGPNTAPKTFRFSRNVWYCEDQPSRSRPVLPVAETAGVYGRDPLLRQPSRQDFRLRPGSPAAGRGAGAKPR